MSSDRSIPTQSGHAMGPGPHVAVFNVPQPGHVLPTLAVVEELVRRGCRVSYAVTEQFAQQVRAAGATPVVHQAAAPSEAPEDMVLGAAQAVQLSLDAVGELASAFDRDRPDIVLYDVYAWAGALLANSWGVPMVHLAPSHVAYEGVVQEMFGLQDISQIPGFAGLAAALAAHGFASGVHELTLAPEHVVAFFPRSFQRRPDTVRATDCHYVGPALSPRAFQGGWRRPASSRKVLYVSLGSQFTRRPAFYRTCIEAFRDSDWHVVMTVGSGVSVSELGHLPGNFEVHASVPQLVVLSEASAFVTHGGMGSTMEALAHGVPLVAVPQMAEQRVNAEQIERLGLGVHLPRERVTARSLGDAVRRVSRDQDIAAAVGTMRRTIAESGGAVAAADAVQGILSSRSAAVR